MNVNTGLVSYSGQKDKAKAEDKDGPKEPWRSIRGAVEAVQVPDSLSTVVDKVWL